MKKGLLDRYWDQLGLQQYTEMSFWRNFGTCFVFENTGILSFCAYCISDSYSAIHTVHLDQPTNHQVTPAQRSVSVTPSTGTWREFNIFMDFLCPAIHSWLLTSSLMCWHGTVLNVCRRIQMWCDREGKRVGSFGRSWRLKIYSTQFTQPILST